MYVSNHFRLETSSPKGTSFQASKDLSLALKPKNLSAVIYLVWKHRSLIRSLHDYYSNAILWIYSSFTHTVLTQNTSKCGHRILMYSGRILSWYKSRKHRKEWLSSIVKKQTKLACYVSPFSDGRRAHAAILLSHNETLETQSEPARAGQNPWLQKCSTAVLSSTISTW